MGLVQPGKITLKEASEKIGVSYRQAKRILKAVENKGTRGLIHGNPGRHPPNRISERVKQQVLNLSRRVYEGFNDLYSTEVLTDQEEVASRGRDRAEAQKKSSEASQMSGADGLGGSDGTMGWKS
jgi:molybdenum-dependent DNA-binding transcriptional regulator ModE